MSPKFILIVVGCCLLDCLSLVINAPWIRAFAISPPIGLAVLYYIERKEHLTIKDWAYLIGVGFAAIADGVLEFQTVITNIITLILYMLSFSFYAAIARRETNFNLSGRELIRVVVVIAILIMPILAIFERIPAHFFFASMIYMVFLGLLCATALTRKTNKLSYRWFLAGALTFAVLTVLKVYFKIVIPFEQGGFILKPLYTFAQYSICVGTLKSYNSKHGFESDADNERD